MNMLTTCYENVTLLLVSNHDFVQMSEPNHDPTIVQLAAEIVQAA